MKVIKKARRKYKKAQRLYLKHAKLTFFLGFIGLLLVAWEHVKNLANWFLSFFL